MNDRDLRRRTVLTCGVFAITLMIGAYVVKSHPVPYAANATIVFVGSPTVEQYEVATQLDVEPDAQSYLARYQDTTVVGDIFARVYRDRTKLAQLADDGLVGRLSITTRASVLSPTPDHGPVLVFNIFSPTPDDALAGVNLVLADLQTELDQRQAGFDPNLSVGAAVVSTSERATLSSGSRMRAAAGFTILATLLAICTRAGFTTAVERRSAPTTERTGEPPAGVPIHDDSAAMIVT